MISVVIPALNEERNIGALLDSLASQVVDEKIEVVVADAGSTDKTCEIVHSYSQKFSRVSIVKGGMPAVGRNNGGKDSSGDPVVFLDADLVLPFPEFLKATVEYFRSHHLGIATTPLRPLSSKWLDRVMVGAYNFILIPAKYVRPLGAMCIVASREVFEKTGGYPEDVIMAEDHDFIKNSLQFGKYDILPLPVFFSVRRFNKEGRFVLIGKYLKATFHHVIHGPIRKEVFKYEFRYTEHDEK